MDSDPTQHRLEISKNNYTVGSATDFNTNFNYNYSSAFQMHLFNNLLFFGLLELNKLIELVQLIFACFYVYP